MSLYAHVTMNQDFPPRPRPGILHLDNIRDHAGTWVDVTAAKDFAAFVSQHPEIGWASVHDSRFPQRGRKWSDFIAKDARKLWPEAELLAAFREAKQRQMADPNYVPTVAEALDNPKEFVDGMQEE